AEPSEIAETEEALGAAGPGVGDPGTQRMRVGICATADGDRRHASEHIRGCASQSACGSPVLVKTVRMPGWDRGTVIRFALCCEYSGRPPISTEEHMPDTQPRLAILGAGPIGLEAALAAADRGVAFTVYDAGPAVAGHVRD